MNFITMENMKTLQEIQTQFDELLKKRNEIDAELLMLQGEARLLKGMESPEVEQGESK